jgi:hypothetical protein
MKHDNLSFKKSGIVLFILTSMIAGLIFFTAGCDNKDSYEAKLEDARIALDNGNYAEAKAILASLAQTPEVLQYMSNAISGGDLNIDTLHIIQTLDTLKDDNQGSIDMVGKLLGADANGILTCSDIDKKLTSVNEALQLFKTISTMNGSLTDDQKLQRGLLSVSRTILTLARIISCDAGVSPVYMTEQWIKANRASFLININVSNIDAHTNPNYIQTINEDLDNIEIAALVVTGTNDFKTNFDGFRNDLDTSGDGTITGQEIKDYLSNM